MGRNEKVSTMTPNDLEKDLKNAKRNHLTENELESYLDHALDDISLARIEAHLKLCLICEGWLAVLKEEALALDNLETTAEDVVLVKRAKHQMASQQQLSDSRSREGSAVLSLTERLTEYLRQAVANWQAHFLQLEIGR